MPITRVGLLGAGTIATHHAIAARAAGALVEVACTRRPDSPNWTRLREVAPNVRQADGIDDVLDDPNVEGVVVCLSWDAIAPILSRLLASDKPMLIEKPIVFSSAKIPTGSFVNKMVGYNRRFYKVVEIVKQRISQNGVKSVEVAISEDVGRHIRRHGESIVPRILEFASSHTLDLLHHLLGPLKVVHANAQTDPGSKFTSYNGLLLTEDDAPVFLALNENDPLPAGIRVRFVDHTAWVLSPLERLSVYEGVDVTEPTENEQIRRYEPIKINEYLEDASMKPGFLQQMKAFLSGQFSQAATIDDTRRQLQLIKEIRDAGSVSKSSQAARGGAS
ncbi:MAG: hypothetical protein CMJ78_09325 [Planctomycetaceae bacterium]|nr:hypothetical protein [Planctomycetaceae bacterium]